MNLATTMWASSPRPDAAAGHDLGGQRGLRELRIVPGPLAGATDISGPGDLADEQRRRAVVEPLTELLADADPDGRAARAAFLGVGEVELDALALQFRRLRPSAVPTTRGS